MRQDIDNLYFHMKMHDLRVLNEEIEKHDLDINVLDVSYINDPCYSFSIVTNDKDYLLFLPNSWRNQNEETTTYTLILDEEYGFEQTFYKTFDNLEQVINYILFQLA